MPASTVCRIIKTKARRGAAWRAENHSLHDQQLVIANRLKEGGFREEETNRKASTIYISSYNARDQQI